MAGILSRMLGFSKPQTQEAVPTKGNPEDEINIVCFAPHTKLVSSSTPFGGKIEVMLRLAGLPYKIWNGDPSNKAQAPKGKFPVLHHGTNAVPDSKAIVEYLSNTYPEEMAIFAPDPNSPLKCNEAIATMTQRMLEEHTYFCVMYILCQRDENWEKAWPVILQGVPAPMRRAISLMFRGQMLRDLHGQGVGRHSLEEVEALLEKDLDACEQLLTTTGAYLAGTSPCEADCFLFGMIDGGLDAENLLGGTQPSTEMLKRRPALMAFYNRLRDKLFPDGVSENWQPGMFNVKDAHTAAAAAAAAKVAAEPSTSAAPST